MSKFDEALERYQGEMSKLGIKCDVDLLKKVAKGLGPSIYNEDSSKVSCSDKEELARVKNNFLLKKLGMKDSPALDAAIQDVCQQLGSANRNKFRAMFYYLLVKKLGKESFYA
ncbi:MAG: DUF2853 family protein [Calditrichaeota bacterium]|nr:DUF2853 family protein [Calditrichota bacterium]MCB9068993.1 DUF2853 family protein [Calditrichia bacterium]